MADVDSLSGSSRPEFESNRSTDWPIGGSTGCWGNLMAPVDLPKGWWWWCGWWFPFPARRLFRLRFSGSGSLKNIGRHPAGAGLKLSGRLGTSWIGRGRKGARLWWAIWGMLWLVNPVGVKIPAAGTGVINRSCLICWALWALVLVLPKLSNAWTACCLVVDWSCKQRLFCDSGLQFSDDNDNGGDDNIWTFMCCNGGEAWSFMHFFQCLTGWPRCVLGVDLDKSLVTSRMTKDKGSCGLDSLLELIVRGEIWVSSESVIWVKKKLYIEQCDSIDMVNNWWEERWRD